MYSDWIVLAIVIGFVWIFSGSDASIFLRFEQKLALLSLNRRLSLMMVGGITLLARLAVFPWLAVPQPAIHDEYSYLLSADTFAHWRLANPPHPFWLFFETFHVIQHPSYASIYPPAQGAALALGKMLGSPWVGVLLSTTAMCMALTWMLQAWVPPRWALLGGLLAVFRFGIFSYWMNSYWGGSVPAIGAALVMGSYPRILEACRPRHLLAFGAGVAILATGRPMEGFIFCVPVSLALLWDCLPIATPAQKRNARRILFTFAIAIVGIAGFISYYNWRVTGSPLTFPHFIEQQEYVTTPVFLWQRAKPSLHYTNPQFETFYNWTMPAMYQRSWSGARDNIQGNALLFWQFFIGPAFSIPLLMLPWVFRDRKMRLPLVQFGLSTLGLLVVVWFHPHYAAPLLATTLLLVVQSLRHLRVCRYSSRRVGLAAVRLTVLLSILAAPIAFLVSRWPGFYRFWMSPAEGWALLCMLSLLLILAALGILGNGNRNPVARIAPHNPAREFMLVLLFACQVCIGLRIAHASNFQFDVNDTSSPRTWVEQKFASLAGEHLVLVRYSPHHNIHREYVYNDADIDHAKTVWAREIPGQNLVPLLTYFHNRDVWVLEPDEQPERLYPYLPSPLTP
jgi:hypothetical protein